MDNINAACICPNVKCQLHGNCKACKETHRKSYCESPKWLQNVVGFFMPKEKKYDSCLASHNKG
jgi:hypothetical protein